MGKGDISITELREEVVKGLLNHENTSERRRRSLFPLFQEDGKETGRK
jgi:hypothetical protein